MPTLTQRSSATKKNRRIIKAFDFVSLCSGRCSYEVFSPNSKAIFLNKFTQSGQIVHYQSNPVPRSAQFRSKFVEIAIFRRVCDFRLQKAFDISGCELRQY